MHSKPVALITGASRGIGREVALELVRRDWAVAICARNSEQLSETQEICKKEGHQPVLCLAREHDIRRPITPFLKEIIERCGRIDALINNAGVTSHKSFILTSSSEVRDIIDINLVAQMELSREALPYLLQREHGTIVNVLSSAGKFGFPNMAAYCASKHGLLGFTKALAAEMKSTSVRVIGVCPARVDTEMHRQTYPQVYKSLLRYTILKPATVAKRIVDATINPWTRNGLIMDIDPWRSNLLHKLRELFR
jgi:short-subunit dehydrogenase